MLLLAFFLSGCAEMPQQALDNARAALATADSAEADRYVPELYQAAQDSFAVAQTEMETQNNMMALSRNYVRTRKLLEATTAAATQAANAVPARKEQMQEETTRRLTDLPRTITRLNQRITQAARQRARREAANAARETMQGTDQLLANARTALADGDIATAYNLTQQVQDKIQEAERQLG
jgi:hypothetical protein